MLKIIQDNFIRYFNVNNYRFCLLNIDHVKFDILSTCSRKTWCIGTLSYIGTDGKQSSCVDASPDNLTTAHSNLIMLHWSFFNADFILWQSHPPTTHFHNINIIYSYSKSLLISCSHFLIAPWTQFTSMYIDLGLFSGSGSTYERPHP